MVLHEKIDMKFENLITCRGFYNQHELCIVISKMEAYIKNNGARKIGIPITATYESDTVAGKADIQMLIPIDKEIPSFQEFVFMPELSAPDCLMARHKGSPHLIPDTFDIMMSKAKDKGYAIRKPAYNVIIVEPTPANLSALEMDIYLPIDI